MIKAIFFDAGGVLVQDRSKDAFRKFKNLTRVSLTKARAAYFSFDRTRLMEGKITRYEFYRRVCKKLGCPPFSQNDIVSFVPSGKPPINPRIFQIVKQLKKRGYIVGVISNTVVSRRQSIFWSLYGRLFRPLILSYEVGVKKPKRQIFEIARRRAGIKFSEMAFIDDHRQHVAAAKRFGIIALMYKSPQDLVHFLRHFGIKI